MNTQLPFSVLLKWGAFLLLLILGPEYRMHAQEDWELKKEEEDILAYTRKTEGSKFAEYRVESVFHTRLHILVAIMQDPETYAVIFEDSKEVQLKKREGDKEIYVYVLTGAPFPVKDRAGVYKNTYQYHPGSKTVRMDIECVDDYYENRKRVVQIQHCGGYWEFRDIGEGKVHVIHQFHANPGGKVPAFLVNKKIISSPMYTFKKMKELITMEKYEGSVFTFLP